MGITRRRFIGRGLGAALVAPLAPGLLRAQSEALFQHGVASGDPLADRVILWTRVTAPGAGDVDVAWRIGRDPELRRIDREGVVPTGPHRDFTVKVDADGLAAGSTYYYQFEADGQRSPIGRTKTLPAGAVDRVRLAVCSCSNYPFGYFNAYRRLAERADLDVVLHLGDYLYEYRNGQYGDGTPFGRVPAPDKEMVTLQDYRIRYAQYRTDADLQEVHRHHPFIAVWDDHESTNNSWHSGAQNHDPGEGEGDWQMRKAASVRAYYEWLPIREVHVGRQIQIYRTFSFGDLLDLVMLDTRLTGRDEPAVREDLAAIDDPRRTLLGASQEAWLFDELRASQTGGTRWRMLGQQVMFGQLRPDNGPVRNTDQWDGYPAARNRLLDVVERDRIDNLIVLTGDVHASYAMDVTRDPWAGYDADTGRGSMLVEFVAPAVTSPSGYSRRANGAEQIQQVIAGSPHLKYLEGMHRGYVVVDVTRERTQADWIHVPTITEQATEEFFAKGFIVGAGAPHLVEASEPVGD